MACIKSSKKLFNVILNRRKPDDRDSFCNKRIDMAGQLLGQLFKQYYKKMMNDKIEIKSMYIYECISTYEVFLRQVCDLFGKFEK